MNAFDIIYAGISALGWCLLQFVWQAALIGTVYAVMRPLLARGNPRYLAAMLALAAMALCPLVTWHVVATNPATVGLADMITTGSSAVSPSPAASTWTWHTLVQAALPWLVLAWAFGVVALGGRVFRQWRGLRLMLRMAENLPVWQSRTREFANRMGLRRVVPVLASVRVATPTLVGWLRPAVVMPLAVLARMPASQIDLVLAHELAHLKRLDHVANLFQVVLETLMFYHPVVHWISREARNERELCCDTLALRVTGGERRDFVAALANLEELRASHAGLALAASGGVLAERAWFIAGGVPRGPRRHLRNHAVLMLVALVLAGAGWMWWREAAWQQRTAIIVAANNASVLRVAMSPDVLPASASLPLADEAPVKPVLPPVHYATVSVPDTEAASPAASIRLVSVGRPTLDLANVALPLAAVAAVTTPSSRTVEVPFAPPRVLRTVSPVYPPEALLNGIQGRVVVEFALDAAGVPRDVEIVGNSTGQFDAAALQALTAWRFVPPVVAGRRYRQAFTFQLGAQTVGDAAAARACLVTTGTHICRQVPDASVRVLRSDR
ncbi:MAG TPA: TonB family protein [Rhodanobacteraceae bacterium]|nr:TonB family protein [Rhodanobacteraceae bacterium]